MDYYDQIVVERGEREALAIAMDDARKLRRHLSLIELMAATASAAELIRRGVALPDPATWEFLKGWRALCHEILASHSSQVPGAVETVRMIAAGDVSWLDVDLHVWRARCIRDLLQYGFRPPDYASEDFARGWEAACSAFASSDEADWLAQALADAEEACNHARRKAQGREE